MDNAGIFIAGHCGNVFAGGKARKVVFKHKPTAFVPCAATIKDGVLIVTGSGVANIVDKTLTTNGNCIAAIENNILHTVGG